MCRLEKIELDTYKHDSKAKKKGHKGIQVCQTPVIREQFCCEQIKGKSQKTPFTK